MSLESRDAGSLAPKEAGIGPASGFGGAISDSHPGYPEPSGPTPRALADISGSRKLIYAAAALGLGVAIFGGLYVAGVFDDAPAASGQRGVAPSLRCHPRGVGPESPWRRFQ